MRNYWTDIRGWVFKDGLIETGVFVPGSEVSERWSIRDPSLKSFVAATANSVDSTSSSAVFSQTRSLPT